MRFFTLFRMTNYIDRFLATLSMAYFLRRFLPSVGFGSAAWLAKNDERLRRKRWDGICGAVADSIPAHLLVELSFRDFNYRNQIVNNDEEIPHCVRNDSVFIYIWMGKSSGKAAAFSHPPSLANARHFDRREKSPQKCVIGTAGRNLLQINNSLFYNQKT